MNARPCSNLEIHELFEHGFPVFNLINIASKLQHITSCYLDWKSSKQLNYAYSISIPYFIFNNAITVALIRVFIFTYIYNTSVITIKLN